MSRGGWWRIARQPAALLAAWLAAALLLPLPAHAQDIIGWRLGHQGDGVHRLVIDLTAGIQPRLFTLSDPYRLVADFDNAAWRPAASPPAAAGPVGAVRFGTLQPGVTRMVVDLTGPARLRSGFLLGPRDGFAWRLVLDLETTSRDAFMASVQQRLALSAAPSPAGAAADAPRLGLVSPLLNPPIPSARPYTPPLPRTGAITVDTSALPGYREAEPSPPPPGLRPGAMQTASARPPSLLPSLTSPANAATPSMGTLKPGADAIPIVVPIQPPAVKPPARRAAGRRTIAIDAGHGGIDPGAVSLSGGYEKHITLEVAREIRKQLEASGRYRVVMTRDRDEFVRLRDRVAIARAADADLFISIHADAIGNSTVGGLSIYTLSETASDREAEALAAKENKSDLIAGIDLGGESPEVTNILIDLAQRETKNYSAGFAGKLVRELARETRLLGKPHRFAGFAVLTAPDVPSVLVELGYLSNRSDEKELRDPAHRAKLARGILRAVDGHFAHTATAQRN